MYIKLFLIGCLGVCLSCSSIDGQDDNEGTSFANVFSVDRKTSQENDLPPTKFSLEYPDDVTVLFPDNKRDHITIQVMKDGLVIEELWISKTNLKAPERADAKGLLDSYVTSFEGDVADFSAKFVGEAPFKGAMTYQIRAIVDFSELQPEKYAGKYRMLLMIPFPERDQMLNAVSVTMIANQKSEIKSFADFGKEGVISKIWNTFKYIE